MYREINELLKILFGDKKFQLGGLSTILVISSLMLAVRNDMPALTVAGGLYIFLATNVFCGFVVWSKVQSAIQIERLIPRFPLLRPYASFIWLATLLIVLIPLVHPSSRAYVVSAFFQHPTSAAPIALAPSAISLTAPAHISTPTVTASATPNPTTPTLSPTWTQESTATLAETPVPPPMLTPTATGGDSGELSFVSDRKGHRNIYTIRADGSGISLAVGGLDELGWPAWSPDGRRIAFVDGYSTGGYGRAIVIANPDGTNPAEITNRMGSHSFSHPAWSPSGDEILFNVLFYQGNQLLNYVYAIRADGSKWSGLELPQGVGNQLGGVWSPDSQHILFYFANLELSKSDIYIVRRYDSQLTQLTNLNDLAIDPSWSPDGGSIAFSRNGDIWVMDAAALNLKQLTTNPAIEIAPTWSLDGQLIAFQGKQTGNWDIYVVAADGTSPPVNITNDPATDNQPTWRP